MCASWSTIFALKEQLLVAAKRQQQQETDGTIRTTRAAADAPRKQPEKQCSQNHAWQCKKPKAERLAKGYLGRRGATRNREKATEIRTTAKQNIRPEQAKTMHRAELMDVAEKLWWKARLYSKFMKQG